MSQRYPHRSYDHWRAHCRLIDHSYENRPHDNRQPFLRVHLIMVCNVLSGRRIGLDCAVARVHSSRN